MTLPATEQAVPAARHWIADELMGAESATSELAQLLTSELVANAVLYGMGTEVRVRMGVVDADLLIEIWDANPVDPQLQVRDLTSTSGRGLKIVDALADQWGCSHRGTGKWVWFRINMATPKTSGS
ncbi:MAG TPA: ATP-binding protein [Actinomycetes bacterium]|nr:ATP-binding protein [Actinomycetes bacterium]